MKSLISLVASMAVALMVAQASADVTLNIVPASSSLTMGGSLNGSALSAQGAGGNVTSYTGTIAISDPGATFSFVSSDASANNSGNWQPLVGGAAGTAPANYGMRATVIVTVNASARGLHLALSGSSLALTGNNFAASAVTLSVAAGSIDYNAGAFGTGTGSLVGLTAPAGTGMGTVVVNGSTVTLTIPVNSTLNTTVPTALGNLPVVVTLTGNIVATGTLPVQNGACCRGSTCVVTTAAACPVQPNQRFAGVGSACNVAGNTATPCCKANFNQDAGIDVGDIFEFLNAWLAGNLTTDIDGGGQSVDDIFAFLNAWFAGC